MVSIRKHNSKTKTAQILPVEFVRFVNWKSYHLCAIMALSLFVTVMERRRLFRLPNEREVIFYDNGNLLYLSIHAFDCSYDGLCQDYQEITALYCNKGGYFTNTNL